MTTVDTSIYGAAIETLRTHLLVMPSLELLAPGGIAWDGQPYTPDLAKAYIRESMKEAPGRRTALGPRVPVRHKPLYLLDCFTPRAQGREATDRLGDAVQSHFWPGLQIIGPTLVVTIVYSGPLPTVTEPNWRMKPVTIACMFDTLTPD